MPKKVKLKTRASLLGYFASEFLFGLSTQWGISFTFPTSKCHLKLTPAYQCIKINNLVGWNSNY